jgi:hypothetical protein
MSAKRYEFVTTLCLLTAVLSSVLYGKLGSLNWLSLGLAIAAATAAISTYFYNATHPEKSAPCLEAPRPVQGAAILHGPDHDFAIEKEVRLVSKTLTIPAEVPSRMIHGILWGATRSEPVHHNHKYSLLVDSMMEVDGGYFHKRIDEAALQPLQLRERQLFLDEVVQLVDRLAPTCEVEVSLADRHLTIRPGRPVRFAQPTKTRVESDTQLRGEGGQPRSVH